MPGEVQASGFQSLAGCRFVEACLRRFNVCGVSLSLFCSCFGASFFVLPCQERTTKLLSTPIHSPDATCPFWLPSLGTDCTTVQYHSCSSKLILQSTPNSILQSVAYCTYCTSSGSPPSSSSSASPSSSVSVSENPSPHLQIFRGSDLNIELGCNWRSSASAYSTTNPHYTLSPNHAAILRSQSTPRAATATFARAVRHAPCHVHGLHHHAAQAPHPE